MERSFIFFLISLFAVSLLGCSALGPSKDFLDSKIGVVYSAGALSVPSKTLKLREFVGKGLKPGRWEKAEEHQWIYRVKNTDAMTKQESETAILFVRHPESHDIVIFARVAVNGTNLNSLEKDYLFNQIAVQMISAQKEQKMSSTSNSEQEIATTAKQETDPCADAATTAAINECAEKKFQEADKELNIAYKAAMAKLDEKRKTILKNEQRTWIKKKEAKCKAEAKEVEGGTIWTSVYVGCLTEITKQRTQELKSYN